MAWVYFVQLGNRIKIGYSTDVPARLGAIPGRYLTVIEGDRTTEAALHARFRGLHDMGEWFEAGPALLEYIAALPPLPIPPRPTHAGRGPRAVLYCRIPVAMNEELRRIRADSMVTYNSIVTRAIQFWLTEKYDSAWADFEPDVQLL